MTRNKFSVSLRLLNLLREYLSKLLSHAQRENVERRPIMANKNLFSTKNINGKASKTGSPASRNVRVPKTDTINEAGGKAYSFPPKHGLAQYVSTGCLGNTYYAGGAEQLEMILNISSKLSVEFLAKCAVYARQKAFMKDTPALLLAIIAARAKTDKERDLFSSTFNQVVDNGKMLQNFVQIVRSGKTGRSSFGSRPKKLIQNWLTSVTDKQIINASIGNEPSLADIIKMVHPHAEDKKREALLGHIIGRNVSAKYLPEVLRDFEDFKKGETDVVPDIPWLMLTSQELSENQWKAIAKNMKWHALRMNLETLQRHGVFKDKKMVDYVARQLTDEEQIRKARVFPYQLLMAYTASVNVPDKLHKALEDALEIATQNIPEFKGSVVVCPDHSGSMHSPVTGQRAGATTQVQCVDVAALISACVLRKNPEARVLPFAESVNQTIRLNPRDTVMSNANVLRRLPAGGTNCSAPLQLLNREGSSPDLIIFVSDCESWKDFTPDRGTQGMREFAAIQKRNPKAKLVAIDLQPNSSTQFKESNSILNIGGFSDHVFELIADFSKGHFSGDHWVDMIEKTEI